MRTATFQCPSTKKLIILQEQKTNPPTTIVTQGWSDGEAKIEDIMKNNGVRSPWPEPYDKLYTHFASSKMRELT